MFDDKRELGSLLGQGSEFEGKLIEISSNRFEVSRAQAQRVLAKLFGQLLQLLRGLAVVALPEHRREALQGCAGP